MGKLKRFGDDGVVWGIIEIAGERQWSIEN